MGEFTLIDKRSISFDKGNISTLGSIERIWYNYEEEYYTLNSRDNRSLCNKIQDNATRIRRFIITACNGEVVVQYKKGRILPSFNNVMFYFELESDIVAVKLRWISE